MWLSVVYETICWFFCKSLFMSYCGPDRFCFNNLELNGLVINCNKESSHECIQYNMSKVIELCADKDQGHLVGH